MLLKWLLFSVQSHASLHDFKHIIQKCYSFLLVENAGIQSHSPTLRGIEHQVDVVFKTLPVLIRSRTCGTWWMCCGGLSLLWVAAKTFMIYCWCAGRSIWTGDHGTASYLQRTRRPHISNWRTSRRYCGHFCSWMVFFPLKEMINLGIWYKYSSNIAQI